MSDTDKVSAKTPKPHFHRRRSDADYEGHPTWYAHARAGAGESDDKKESDNEKHEDTKNDADGKKEEKDDKQEKKPKKMSPAKKRFLIIVAVVLGAVLILLAVLYWLHARQFEDTDDAFIDGHISQMAAQAGGRIASLLIDDNQVVSAGQLLAVIDPRDYAVKLAQAQAEKAQALAQAALQKANIGQAEANVLVAEADRFKADRDLARFRSIDPKAITQQQLDNAVSNARSAAAKLEASRQSVSAARAQAQAAEASLQQANVDIRNAELQLSYTQITAPINGRITKRTVDTGNVVSVGQPLLAIVSDDLWVTANFKETQLTRMRAGQKVTIHIDAYPKVDFHAHVDSFQAGSGEAFSALPAENATGNYVKVVQRVPVKIVFDDADQRKQYRLAPGLSVEPRVKVR